MTVEPAPVPPAVEPQAQEADVQAPHRARGDRRRAHARQKREVAGAKRKARLAEGRGQVPVQVQSQVPSAPVTTQRREPTRVVAVRTRAGSTRVGARSYVIQPGDTLSGIAGRYGLDWRRLAVLNDLENPDLIYAGDRLLLY